MALKTIPIPARIYQELGRTLWKKAEDPCAAAEAYEQAKELPGSLGFTVRFHGYCMAECPGREKEAYDYLIDLYRQGEKHRTPSVIVALKKLEEQLTVPLILRILDEEPDQRLRRQLEINDAGGNMPWIP